MAVYSPNEPAIVFAADMSQVGGANDDLISVQFYSTSSGTFSLTSSTNANFKSCEQCVVAFIDVNQSGTPAKRLYQQAGSIQVQSSPALSSGGVNATLTGLRLIEVTIASDYTSTPVPNGMCVDFPSPVTVQVARQWTCTPSYYGAGDGCDCNCGMWDPDCDTSSSVYGCQAGQRCVEPGICQGGAGAGWTCPQLYYDALDGCDCECGAWDPDCNVPGQSVLHCSAGQICVQPGVCAYP